MSYQVLARKWRPATFHEMRGQEHVLQALVNGLDSDRLHHAYLFTGTRGVGKTSVARILAKCLNCEVGVTSKPCGECGACTEIADNRFVDLIEVDAASRTKVEDTRELLENVQYAPSKGRFKIYLIDEVHMLSTHSFNALLKTLEEPPPHVKFLLATTDPQRLPATILSRCLQFSLKNLAPDIIVEHLQTIMAAEGLDAELPALWAIARAAAGSMRDALSLADQAIAYSGNGIVEDHVQSMLGSIDRDSVCELLEVLSQRDAKAVLALAEQVASNGTDLALYLDELLAALHNVAVFQAVADYEAPDLASEQRLKKLASQMLAEDVQLYYQIAVQAQRDLPFAPEPRVGLEMALLRMLTFLPDDESTELQTGDEVTSSSSISGSQLEAGEKKKTELTPESDNSTNTDKLSRAPSNAEITLEAVAGQTVTGMAQPLQAEVNRSDLSVVRPAPTPSLVQDAQASPQISAKPASPVSLKAVPSVKGGGAITVENWLQVFEELQLSGMAKNVASNCELQTIDGSTLIFCLDEANCKLFQNAHVQQLEGAIQQYAGVGFKVQLAPGVVGRETPYLYSQRRKRERQEAAVNSIMADPHVNSLLQTFGGQVEQESITPIASTLNSSSEET